MSLTRFLRKYIYFPLGGSRKGKTRTMINVLMVFLVSGIWHGAAWTFILWGILHGVANVLNRLFNKQWEKIPRLIRWFGTFVFVNLTWILFRAESMQNVKILYSKLIQPWEWRISGELLNKFDLLEFTYIEEHVGGLGELIATYPWLHLLIVATIAIFIALIPKNCHEKKFVPNVKNAICSVVLLVWSILSLSGLSTFLYFNF